MSTDGILRFQNTKKATFVGPTSNISFDTVNSSLGIGVTGDDVPSSNLYITGNAYVSSNLALGGVLTMGTVNVVARHSLQAVTETGNATSVTTEFTNPTTSLVASGNVEVGGDMNLLHKANTASIKLNSNVVTEFPRSKKLIKYPRVALTSASQDGYVVTASNVSVNGDSHAVYRVFDNILPDGTTTVGWRTDVGYDPATGLASGITTRFTGDSGEWVEIQLPNSLKVLSINLKPGNETDLLTSNARFPKVFVIYGYDGNAWVRVEEFTTSPIQSFTDVQTFHISNPVGEFSKFVLVVKQTYSVTGAASGVTMIGEIEYFGVPEYDPDAAGVDVKVTSYPNVPNTDWLEVYYDAKDLADGAVTSVDDLTPSGTNDGTATNVTVSDGAFVFNGMDSKITTGTTLSDGAYPHSICLWYYTNDNPSTLADYLFQLGDNTENNSPNININGATFYLSFYGNYLYTPVTNTGIQQKKWVQISYSYDGGATTSNNPAVYIDGKQIPMTGPLGNSAGSALSLVLGTDPNLHLTIGSRRNDTLPVNGKIANFRLFNRPLTSDEVWQLYAYQKEYFGHGDLSMTLKAGRLGIGTSEPRAALDVMGRLYGPGTIPCFSIHTGDYWGADYSSWGTTTGRHWQVVYRTPLPFIQRTWLEYDTHNVISFVDYPTTTNTGTKTIFTAPMSGFYHFSFNIGFKTNSANDYVAFMLSKNDTEPYNGPASDVSDYFLGVAQQIDVGMSYHIGSSVNIFLKKGETVVPYSRSVSSLYVSNGGGFNFSGYFIG